VEPPGNDGIEGEPAADRSPRADDGIEGNAPAAAPVPAPVAPPTENQVAAAAEVLVARRTRGQIAAGVVWNSMIAIAILLALVTIAVTIVGITGGHL
jgi:hypothetical protein